MKNLTIKGEPEEVAAIRQKILESFSDLKFIEEGHQYFLHGVSMPSVTQLIEQFQTPFDKEFQAKRYAERHGNTAEHWLKEWQEISEKATTAGTKVHSFGESMGWLRNGHPELITDDCKCKYDERTGRLVPTNPKEKAVANFWDSLPENYHLVLAETKIYSNKNPRYQLKHPYCGTFDLLFYYKSPTDASKNGLVIFDYKTNKDLHSDYNNRYHKTLLTPFEDLIDESLSMYTLQLNCYQIPLEDIGLKVIGRCVVHLLDDGNFKLYKVGKVTQRLREVL